MSKRRYKSEEFKKVDWDQVRSRITGERVVVAVDVPKEDFVATAVDGEQTALVTFKWRHPWETNALFDRVVWLGQTRRLEAAMESSGTYGDASAWQLRQRAIALYRVSPKRVRDVAEVFDGVPSLHDAKAPYLIGRLHLQGISQPWPSPVQPGARSKPSVARFYLYFAALCLIGCNPLVKRWYVSRISRPGGAPKNKSLITLTRKVAEALWPVARGAVYWSEKLFNSNAVLSL
jgi:hypothetical protein